MAENCPYVEMTKFLSQDTTACLGTGCPTYLAQVCEDLYEIQTEHFNSDGSLKGIGIAGLEIRLGYKCAKQKIGAECGVRREMRTVVPVPLVLRGDN